MKKLIFLIGVFTCGASLWAQYPPPPQFGPQGQFAPQGQFGPPGQYPPGGFPQQGGPMGPGMMNPNYMMNQPVNPGAYLQSPQGQVGEQPAYAQAGMPVSCGTNRNDATRVVNTNGAPVQYMMPGH